VQHRNRRQLEIPQSPTRTGSKEQRYVWVYPSKPPKRRFKTGDKFKVDGAVYELVYMYRLKDDPLVWLHCLEEQKESLDAIAMAILWLGAGKSTPRVVYDAFGHSSDASQYFFDIPANGSRIVRTTQQLLKANAIMTEEKKES